MTHADDPLRIGGAVFHSRLILGTGKFADARTMLAAVKRAQSELVTVALRRFNPRQPQEDLLAPLAEMGNVTLMPNTSGALDAREAIHAAHIARELSGSNFIKIEIHPNPHHLLPDPIETYEAARVLVKEGFTVLPYMPPDPVLAHRLEDVGCAAVMPLASPIGSGQGLTCRELLRIIVRDSSVPVVIDAGLRSPSEAAECMEMGCDAVLVNSAVAAADDPPAMAGAFALAVQAGRAAYYAGIMSRGETAAATSPLTSFLSDQP